MYGGDRVAVVDHQQQPAPADDLPRNSPKDWRRRSADVGGLNLATRSLGQGQGWLGGDSLPVETIYAELLSDMYTETVNSVNDNSLDSIPQAVPESVRSRLIHAVDRWHFEPHKLPDEEVLACTLILFETLFRIEGMGEVIPINIQQITSFIHHLRKIYRYENTYHNFEHALDVLQATHCYLKSAGMVPSPLILLSPKLLWKPQKAFNSGSLVSCLGLLELFVLYVAAIGHDVGHPGFTNMFMKNANTPLSLVFDHTSALEQMHYQLLKRVMRTNGLGVMLDDPVHGNHVREVLRSSVLFTDMGVHNDFMTKFKKLIDGEAGTLCQRQTIVCQAILKNADISNPCRPFIVSTHWAKALMQEWTAQANLEQEYDLTPTVMSSTDPVKETESQIFFIKHFVKPMLQLTVKAIPEMNAYFNHCRKNLRTWEQRKVELQKCPQSQPQPPTPPPTAPQPDESEGWRYIRSKPSRSILGPPPSSAPASLSVNDPSSSFSLLSPSPSSSGSFASSSEASPLSPLPPTPRNQSGSFMTAFSLTLPAYPPKKYLPSDSGSAWTHTTSSSTSSSRCTSEHGEAIDSPVTGSALDLPPFPTSQSQSQLRSSIPASEASSSSPPHHIPNRRRSNSSLASASSSNSSTVEASAPPSVSTSDAINLLFTRHHPAVSIHSNASGSLIADDEQQPDLNPIHAAIRNASRVGTLRQQRQRRAVRYSWCAGMAGLTGSTGLMTAFQQYQETSGPESQEQHDHPSQLSRVPSEASSTDSSPAIPPSPVPASLDAGNVLDETFTATATTSNSRLSSELSSSQPPDHSGNTPTPRLSPPISLPSLRVRSPS